MVVAGSFINLVSSYGREYYKRSEFVLTEQVIQQKQSSEDFLYQMIPKSIAEQLTAKVRVWYGMVWCGLVVWYGIVWYGMI